MGRSHEGARRTKEGLALPGARIASCPLPETNRISLGWRGEASCHTEQIACVQEGA